jgi:hypothetical protein
MRAPFLKGPRRVLLGRGRADVGGSSPSAKPFDALQAGANPAYFMHGTTALWTSYSGPAFKLQRTSDSVQLDWAQNSLSADITAWLGGSAYTMPTLYDQSGNARHATATTTQLNLTLTIPTLVFSGAANRDVSQPGVGFSNAQAGLTIAAYGKLTSNPAASKLLLAVGNEAANNQNRISVGVSSAGKFIATGRRLTGDVNTTLTGVASADTTSYHSYVASANFATKAVNLLSDGVAEISVNMATAGNTPASNGRAITGGNNEIANSPWTGECAFLGGWQTAGDATFWAAVHAAQVAAAPPFDPSLLSSGWAPNIVIGG